MFRSQLAIFFLLHISALGAHATPPPEDISARVIYGQDGRRDLYQVSDARLRSWARSTVALIPSYLLEDVGHSTHIDSTTLEENIHLCSDEPFRHQLSAANCTGALVGPNVVLTAGHCVHSLDECSKYRFIFDFAVDQEDSQPEYISKSQVYQCKRVLHTQSSPSDYALVELDRPVHDRAPLKLGTTHDLRVNTPLVVIGHPVGLPMKVDSEGHVRNLTGEHHFLASLDTYGGNSGSPVFNAVTGTIVGVLVRGDQDFVMRGGCYISKHCPENGCRGEDVTRIENVLRVFHQ